MSEAPFNSGDEVIVTTTSWRRVFTVKSSNSHRTTVTGPRGAERVLVLGGDGQWSVFAYGRDRARSRPCSVEFFSCKFDHPVTLGSGDTRTGLYDIYASDPGGDRQPDEAALSPAMDYDAADAVIRALCRSTFLGYTWNDEMGPTARAEMRRLFALAAGGESWLSDDGGLGVDHRVDGTVTTLPSRAHFAAGLDFADAVRRETNAIADMLISKNAAYGNSALDPVRIFSQADPVEQIRVRIDDKLSRIQRGAGDDEDTVGDLIGYLVLLRIADGDR